MRNRMQKFFNQHQHQQRKDNFEEKFYEFDFVEIFTVNMSSTSSESNTPRITKNGKINFEHERLKRLQNQSLKIFPPIKISMANEEQNDCEKCRQNDTGSAEADCCMLDVPIEQFIDIQSE
ncbi:hypothetical protein DERF_014385 [Dermatophagoides farinae]|nr:hypothetical protein DERF_014385 [Dermatophagoides farinae]